jgi:alkaline phosphatase D
MIPRTLLFLTFGTLLSARADVHHAQGEMAGEATAGAVLLQSRLTATEGLDASGDVPGAPGVACFEWSGKEDFSDAKRTAWLKADAASDFIIRAHLDGLDPAHTYHYRLVFGADKAVARPGPIRQFKTLPAADATAPVTFCMGSCMNYNSFMQGKSNGGGPLTATDEDKRLGYPSFAAMDALRPDFFIGTGDIVYYDKPDKDSAQALPELRKKWHEQFRFPRLVTFLSHTPAYWSKDDHDFRFNDADLNGDRLPAPSTGIEVFREQMPVHPAGDRASPTYRTHRIHRDVQLWFTEGRDFRSPNRMPDGPEKSLWGKEQREWLQRTLKESDATWKILITPTPMVGPDDASKKDNHVNLGGFRHEADAFFQWAMDNGITNLLTFCGDRHWQYHSIHPSGVEEFSVGALNDENSRKGVPPGSKRGTDPDSLIRQPYAYPEPTGGFVHVTVSEANLRIAFHDDTGKLLYEVIKTP